jgi:hypothetical protein
MKRKIIAVYEDGQQCIGPNSDIIEVPDSAAITITTSCGACDWCVKGAMGRKLSCGHPRIQAARPYVDNVGGISRAVVADTRPTWCPL